MSVLRAKMASSYVISKVIALGLLLSTNLMAMEVDSDSCDSCPTSVLVTQNQSTSSLTGENVHQRALRVHTRFPLHRLIASRDLDHQLDQIPTNTARLQNRQLAQVIDGGHSLEKLSHVQSMDRAWRELELRLKSTRRDQDEKAGCKLGLAKLLMTSDFKIPDRFHQPLDCYNFVLSHLHYVLESQDVINPRKVVHAHIWKALMLTKLTLTLIDHTREETLQVAWDSLETAYQQHATYATLFFQIELIVRYGLRPYNMNQEEAFELARSLFKKINDREYKQKLTSILERPTKGLTKDQTWHLARAAFLNDVRAELHQLRQEFQEIVSPTTSGMPIEGGFPLDIGDRDQDGVDERRIEDSVSDSGTHQVSDPELPESLQHVNNIILPLSPQMVRAFDRQTGDTIFFNEHDVSGFMNDCFFNCTGLTRQEARDSLLNHSGDTTVRQLVAPQILAAMIARHPLPDFFKNQVMAIHFAQLGYSIRHSGAEENYRKAKENVLTFCRTEEAFRIFVQDALSGTRMMEYQRSDLDETFTSIVDALAYIHHFNLNIWTTSDMDEMDAESTTLQQVHWYHPDGATRDVHLHHLRQVTDGIDHFRVLIPAHQYSISSSSSSGSPVLEMIETHTHSSGGNVEQAIYQYYAEGKSKETIAGILKIDDGKVADVLEQRYGIKRKRYSDRLTEIQKRKLRKHLKRRKTLTNVSQKKLARKFDCTPSQIANFFDREKKGRPAPLKQVHKAAIQGLAFNEHGVRNETSNATIAQQLSQQYGRRFESYQVMNYIRTLYRTNQFHPSQS